MPDKKKIIPKGKPFNERTEEELRQITSKGGKNSGEARREKRALRDTLQELLSLDYDVDGTKMGGSEATSIALIKQALKGNVKAYEVIRDTIGEKPTEKVNIENSDEIRIAYEKAAAAIKGKDK